MRYLACQIWTFYLSSPITIISTQLWLKVLHFYFYPSYSVGTLTKLNFVYLYSISWPTGIRRWGCWCENWGDSTSRFRTGWRGFHHKGWHTSSQGEIWFIFLCINRASIYVTVHDEPSVKSHIANSCYRSKSNIIIQFTHPIIAKFSGS